MKRRIIAVVVATMMTASIFAACGNEAAESNETTVEQTVIEETEVSETTEATEASEASETIVEETGIDIEETVTSESQGTPVEHENTIPNPGDTYNGHVVDHTEDQPNCGDSSHGTIFIFYVDSDGIDFIEY